MSRGRPIARLSCRVVSCPIYLRPSSTTSGSRVTLLYVCNKLGETQYCCLCTTIIFVNKRQKKHLSLELASVFPAPIPLTCSIACVRSVSRLWTSHTTIDTAGHPRQVLELTPWWLDGGQAGQTEIGWDCQKAGTFSKKPTLMFNSPRGKCRGREGWCASLPPTPSWIRCQNRNKKETSELFQLLIFTRALIQYCEVLT